MRTRLRPTVWGLLCAVAVTCASPEPAGPELIYTVGGCVEETTAARAATDADVLIEGEGSAIHVAHR